jgi:hypothetical protein
MPEKLTGECLCGTVKYAVINDFETFYHCHCKQCQQITGSAFASNMITSPDNIEWLSGEKNVAIYEHPTRQFTKAFCSDCGSGLPFVTKSGEHLIVPAGSLTDAPTMAPQANIFMSDEACWLHEGLQAKKFDGFAE